VNDTRVFDIFRYDPDRDAKPYMQTYEIEVSPHDRMLLDVLVRLKAKDETLTFRRSCREGVCGSDAMNTEPFKRRKVQPTEVGSYGDTESKTG
jgi:succinate dehydrogenase / fumarate reductase iron-sulfur subunit